MSLGVQGPEVSSLSSHCKVLGRKTAEMDGDPGLEKLEDDSLTDLTEMLMDDWPRAAPVLGMIKQSQRSAGRLISLNIYVDSWPQTRLVVLENLTYKMNDEITLPPLLVYTRNLTAEQIKDKFISIPLLRMRFEGYSEFQHTDYRVYEVLKDFASQHGFRVNKPAACPFIYSLDDKALLRSDIPKGYRISSLEANHADFINANWKHGGSSHTLQRIKTWIQHSFSAGAFCCQTNELVSWGLISETGCISSLQTKELHCGKGLAKAVISELIRQAEEKKIHPNYVYIEEGNVISQNLFQKIGFRKCQDGQIFFFTIV